MAEAKANLLNSSSSSRFGTRMCMICGKSISAFEDPYGKVDTDFLMTEPTNYKSKPLDKVFHVFCDYMDLKRPSSTIFNFSKKNESPFCPSCIQQVFQMYDFHKEKERLTESIAKLVCNFTARIIENPLQPEPEQETSPIIKSDVIIVKQDDNYMKEEKEKKDFVDVDDFKNKKCSLEPPHISNEIASLREEIIKRYSAAVVVRKKIAANPTMEIKLEATLNLGEQDISLNYPSPATVGDINDNDDNDEDLHHTDTNTDSGSDFSDNNSYMSCLTDTDESFDVDESDQHLDSDDDLDYDPNPKKNIKKVPRQKLDEVRSDEPKPKRIRGPYKKTKAKLSELVNDSPRRKRRKTMKLGPNKFAIGEFTFEKVDDIYKCGSCIFTHTKRKRIVYHVRYVHDKYVEKGIVSNRLVEVAPDKFLYANMYGAVKEFDMFRCETCNFQVKIQNKTSFIKHLRHHLDPSANPSPSKSLVCEICGKFFASPSALSTHKRTHVEDRSFPCEMCDKVYKSASGLKIHMESHTGEDTKKFICEMCGQKYRAMGKLKLHMAKHVPLRIYECPDCDKKYTWPAALEYHRRSHQPESERKWYPCDFCDMKFKSKSSIPRHIRVIHNGEKSSEVFRRNPKMAETDDNVVDNSFTQFLDFL